MEIVAKAIFVKNPFRQLKQTAMDAAEADPVDTVEADDNGFGDE